MKRIVRKTAGVSLMLLFFFCATGGVAAGFDGIVVFGDSLSDNGNLLLIDIQPKPDPDFYFEGRLSNGPVWVEYLSEPSRLNLPLHDRALGGAQTDGLVPPGLMEQVAAYIAANLPSLSQDTLYILWAGGNDYLNGDGDFQEAVDNINTAMAHLVEYDARHILLLNLPDLGRIPDTLGTPEVDEATAFSLDFNAALAGMLDQFSIDHPEVVLYAFDVFSFFSEIQNDPAAFGFVNATEPSPNFPVENNFDGAGYLFWDDKHPTTQGHLLLADQVFTDLSAQLPEPPDAGEDDDSSSCFINALLW